MVCQQLWLFSRQAWRTGIPGRVSPGWPNAEPRDHTGKAAGRADDPRRDSSDILGHTVKLVQHADMLAVAPAGWRALPARSRLTNGHCRWLL